jgi:hypothetical protein
MYLIFWTDQFYLFDIFNDPFVHRITFLRDFLFYFDYFLFLNIFYHSLTLSEPKNMLCNKIENFGKKVK